MPCRPVSPVGSSRAGSSPSSVFSERLCCRNYRRWFLLVASSLWVLFSGESNEMTSNAALSSAVHSPISRANAGVTSAVANRSSNAVAPSLCISGPHPWCLSFWASKSFNATAVHIDEMYSTPLTLSDRRGVNCQSALSMSGFLF